MAQPYVPAAGTLQANCRFLAAGQQFENVFSFDYTALGFDDGAVAVVETINTAWWPSVRLVMGLSVSFTEIYIVDLATQNGETRTGVPAVPTTGAVNTGIVPLNVASCVTLRTAKRGKSFRGRSYVGGLAEGSVSNQRVTEAAAADILDAYTNLVGGANMNQVPLVIVSRKSGGVFRPAAVTTRVTSAILRDTIVDSQRRRLPGRGR